MGYRAFLTATLEQGDNRGGSRKLYLLVHRRIRVVVGFESFAVSVDKRLFDRFLWVQRCSAVGKRPRKKGGWSRIIWWWMIDEGSIYLWIRNTFFAVNDARFRHYSFLIDDARFHDDLKKKWNLEIPLNSSQYVKPSARRSISVPWFPSFGAPHVCQSQCTLCKRLSSGTRRVAKLILDCGSDF